MFELRDWDDALEVMTFVSADRRGIREDWWAEAEEALASIGAPVGYTNFSRRTSEFTTGDVVAMQRKDEVRIITSHRIKQRYHIYVATTIPKSWVAQHSQELINLAKTFALRMVKEHERYWLRARTDATQLDFWQFIRKTAQELNDKEALEISEKALTKILSKQLG